MLYSVIFIFILLLITILLMIRINILIEYLKDGYDDHLVISIFIFKSLFKLKYEIPIIDMEKNGIRFLKFKKKGIKEKEKSKDQQKFSFNVIHERIKYLKNLYEKNKALFCEIIRYLNKKLFIKEIRCEIEFGTGSVYYTGILGGVVWAVVGIITSYLENNFRILKKGVKVKTNFKNENLNIDFYCIFTIKIVHIIVIGFRLLIYILNKKISIKKTIGGGFVG